MSCLQLGEHKAARNLDEASNRILPEIFQALAGYDRPERFADLDPEHTLARLLAGFAPVDLAGTYAISNR